eukprot:253597-Prymnesium_polylepis.1
MLPAEATPILPDQPPEAPAPAETTPPPTTPPSTTPTPPPAPSTTSWSDLTLSIPGTVWLKTLEETVSARIRVPRMGKEGKPGSAHAKFKLPFSTAEAVRLNCESAGIPVETTEGTVTTYKGMGPMQAYKFCNTQQYKKFGQGSGALMAPGKFRTDSDTLVFAAPPITVKHDSETYVMEVEFYLVVYNGEGNDRTGRVTLPPNSTALYGTQDMDALYSKTA